MSLLTIKKLKNMGFESLYKKILLGNCNQRDYSFLLSLSVMLLNTDDINLQNLGYRIILMYSTQTKDYSPLYEISLEKGFYPVTKSAEKTHKRTEENIYVMLNRAMMEDWHKERIYLTKKQKELIDFFREKTNESLLINAPTSYGKTDLILTLIDQCQNKKVCILTPTKALLHQTRMRIKAKRFPWVNKIVVNPEMYNIQDESFIAVLTQERLLRLLKENPSLSLDFIVIDEAQNLFEDEQRSVLLSSVIILLNKRNPHTVFKFLSPFVCDENNLKVSYTSFLPVSFHISENIKSELIYLYNVKDKKGLSLYDQYLNDFIHIDNEQENLNAIDFITSHSTEKNIIYFNKPKDIESFTRLLIKNLPDISMSGLLEKAVNSISEAVHSNYYLVEALKKGVVYHHGSMPENIRSFIETLYSKEQDIRYIITSSTLLEGVNMPATSLFMMDCRKGRSYLSASSLKNLFGRICRFNEIFNERTGSLTKLLPKIYFILDEYCGKRANIEKYIKEHVDVERKIADIIENPLLEKAQNVTKKEKAVDFIENFQNGSIENYEKRRIEERVAKSCVLNNVSEIDLIQSEKQLQQKFESFFSSNFENVEDENGLLKVLANVFLPFINESKEAKKLIRLNNEAAQDFYAMFLTWQLDNIPLSQQIMNFVGYWNSLIERGANTIVFVGKWGEITNSFWNRVKETFSEGYLKNWVDIKQKNQLEKINLAIVRVKEEQDFIENSLMKFVEVLKDCGKIEEKFYMKIKYGTTDEITICMIKNGITKSTAKLLRDKYGAYCVIDLESGNVNFEDGLINAMRENGENEIIIHEMKSFL